MALVFISHASSDNYYSSEMFHALKNAGFDYIFLDYDETDGIYMGEEWEKRLYREIQRSHVFLLLLSPQWLESKWCHTEYQWAKALGKELIPVIVDRGENGEVDKWIDQHIQKSDLTQDVKVLSRVISRIKEIAIRTQKGFRWDSNRTPYPGLGSFAFQDAAVFFGREEETLSVIENLHGMQNKNSPKLLNIAAASGMGKSSLLRAGILPKLSLSYKERWHLFPVLRPQKRPLYEVSILFAKYLGRSESYKEIYQKLLSTEIEETIDDLITDIQLKEEKRSILIPVDQAEELFTLSETNEREAFLRMMTYLLAKDGVFSIWTMRSDYLPQMQNHKALYDLLEMQEIFILKPMATEHIRDVIVKPAGVAGTIVEEKLIDRLKEDIETTDALPLLALTLHELYVRYAKEGKLTLQHYKLLGGDRSSNPLEGIIERVADETVAKCQKTVQCLQSLKQAFIPSLVKVKEDDSGFVKRVANWEELPENAYEMINALVDARLLVKKQHDGTVTIEIAHEALIRQWSLLKIWLEEEHDFLRTKAQVESAYEEWNSADKMHKALLSGLQLEKALAFKDKLQGKEKEYVEQSQKYVQSHQVQKRRLTFFVVLLLSVLSIFSGWQWYKAKEQTKIAQDKASEAEVQRMIAERASWQAIKNEQKANMQKKLAIEEKKKLEQSEENLIFKTIVTKIQNSKMTNLNTLLVNISAKDELVENMIIDKIIEYGLIESMLKNIFQTNDFMESTQSLAYIYNKDKESQKSILRRFFDARQSAVKKRQGLVSEILEDAKNIFQRIKILDSRNVKSCMQEKKLEACLKTTNEKALRFYIANAVSVKPEVYYMLSNILFKQKSYKGALINIKKSLSFDPDNQKYIDKLVQIYVANKKYEEAFRLQKRKIEDIYNQVIHTREEDIVYQIKTNEVQGIVTKKLYDSLLKSSNKIFTKRDKLLNEIENNYGHMLQSSEKEIILSAFQIKLRSLKMISFLKEMKFLVSIQLYLQESKNINEKYLNLLDEMQKETPSLYVDVSMKIEEFFERKKKYNLAIKYYIKILKAYTSYSTIDKEQIQNITNIYGGMSWIYILTGEYEKALLSAKRGLILNPSEYYIATNMAHAYLFLGKIKQAKKIYFSYVGVSLGKDIFFEDAIRNDFTYFIENNITNSYYDDILKEIKFKSGIKMFGGIGSKLEYTSGGLEISYIYPNTPAEKSGLLLHDLIVAVDGISTLQRPYNSSINLIRGLPGSSVILTISRGDEIFDVNTTREILHLD